MSGKFLLMAAVSLYGLFFLAALMIGMFPLPGGRDAPLPLHRPVRRPAPLRRA